MVYIIKKDGTKEEFDAQKIVRAVNKSAQRILYTFSQQEIDFICKFATEHVYSLGKTEIPISDMHNIVEGALEKVNPAVAKSYRDYRNYKTDFIHMMDEVYTKSQSIRYIGDKSNANTDSALVATKRSLIFNELNKELYRKFFMNRNELQACKDGYIYIHDQSARLDTMNCCLFDVGNVLKGGFEMGNVWYNEPKTLDTAFDVMGDIVLSTAAQQYGGFTVPEVDKILAPYAQKSYDYYVKEFLKYTDASWEGAQEKAIEYAIDKVRRECDQGWQGIEYKLNTVGSSRGDYPFVTVTLGLGTSMFEKMISISLLEVHKNGQGKKGHKKPVLFPKIVFLYDKAIHGEGGIAEDVFEAGLDCSSKTMYPDWLSMSGEGYIAEMYKKYKRVISPMGCRAFLSPWYERGGMEPADENDKPVFVGRFNIGAVSLHLPMILAKSRSENRDFHEVLDFYLEMIRDLHKRTYDYLGEMRASTNPLAYCEGGFYGGHLKPSDKIRPLLKPMTASFGITALNELQELYNGKSLVEDGQFALDTLKYINDKVAGVLALALIFWRVDDTAYGDSYDEPPLPYIGTEMLGGERGSDWYGVRDLSTLLGGHVYSVGETPYAGTIDTWMQYSTELDFYAPRISALAVPLTHELRDYFMEDGAQTLSIDGFDEAYYAEFIKPNTRLPNEPDDVHQFLILRRGGEVLYFRTEAPDSLREHLDEFADIFNQYSELA